MKNSLLIVTLSVALSACAATSNPISEATATGATAETAQKPDSSVRLAQASSPRSQGALESVVSVQPEDPLPRMALSEDLLFRILTAELTAQRGDWRAAYIAMLNLAQQTQDPRLARRAAELAHGARQAPEILAAVRLWRELAPNSEEANQYFLGFAVLSDALHEARPLLEQRMKDASPQARTALAFQYQRLLARAKDKAAAFTLLEQVLTPYIDTPEIRLALAQAALVNADLDRARQEARRTLEAKPASELAILTLVQATPEKAKAFDLLADFLRRTPDAREVRLARARLLAENKQHDKAKAEFETLLDKDPQDLTALYALGILGLQTDSLEAAEKYLTTYLDILERNPDPERDPAQAMLLLAQIAEERKDTESLLKWLGRIDSGEAYVLAQVRRAQVIAKSGELNDARKLLHGVGAGSERDEVLLITAEGQLLRDADLLDEAMDVYEQGLKRLPENPDLLYDYAMLAEKKGKLAVMESSLRKVIEIAPAHQHAYNALGYSLADRNVRLDEAHALIARALELAPEDAFIIDSMGWVEYRMGRLDRAEKLLRRAYALRPDAEIAAHLGEVLWVKGDREAALQLWREAKAKDPQNDTLKSTLARLNAKP